MANPFSIGLIPSGSRVYIISRIDNFFYSLYISGQDVIFKSLDPSKSKPTIFNYDVNDNDTTLTCSTGYLASDLSSVIPLGQLPQFLTFITNQYNMPENTIYGGINYQTILNSTPKFSSLSENSVAPFGGSESTYFIPKNPTYYFIPSEIPQPNDASAYPTPYLKDKGICQSPQDILPFLSLWMQGNYGCRTTNPEGCVFSTKQECGNNIVFSYCSGTTTCGSCVGKCPEGVEGSCQYNGSSSQPYFACSITNEEESIFKEYKNWIIFFSILLIIMIVLIIFIKR